MGKRKAKASEIAAIEDINKRIRIAKSKANFEEVADLYNQLGNQHRLLGNYDFAVDAHQEEINISKSNRKDKMGLGIAYRNMGEVLTEMKDETEALKYIRMYLKIAQSEDNFVEQQRAYITLGRAYLSMADREESDNVKSSENQSALEKAENSFRQAYKLLCEEELRAKVNDPKELFLMKCNNCQNLGIALELRGKFGDAEKWLYKAIDIGTKYQFNENLAPCYSMLCGLMLKGRKWKDALKAARNATKTAKTLGNQELEVESQLLEAKALFMNDEIDTGRKILKKLRNRIKKKSELHNYFQELDPLLIAAVNISRTQDVLYVSEKTDAQMCMKLHERLGDNYTALANYETSIVHYKKACEFADKADIQGKTLAKLYFSIAETYRDLEDYSSAHKYYLKEMGMHSGNAVEEFKTQTNITLVLEKLNRSPDDEVIPAHQLAVALAGMTNSLIKQITALRNYGLYLKGISRSDEAKKQLDKAKEIQAENNITDLEEVEPDSQDLLGDEDDDIDLDKLSDEEDSDDEAAEKNAGGKTSFRVRLNEVGETQLHLVAKRGDLKAVRRFIRQGHPTNVKDNAGWTPLHEACNFGHATIVEELLKNGANVNIAGGALAEKITPLHDAASNCHCEVMKVLLKYGANVLDRDVEGRLPIESLLAWRVSDAGRSASQEELEAYREVKQLLNECMRKAGKPYRDEDERRFRKKSHSTKRRSGSPTMSLMVSKPRDLECPMPVRVYTDDFDPDEEGAGKNLYLNTIKQMGRKSGGSGTGKDRSTRAISPGPTGPLVPSERNVQNQSDWLLNDDEIDPEEPSTSTSHHTSKPKRKRDPMDDVVMKDHPNSKRKTSGEKRQRRQEEEDDDDNFELMDIHSQAVNSQRTEDESFTPPPSASSGHQQNSEEIFLDSQIMTNDEDFSEFFGNDDDFDVNIPEQEDFLPSQRPPRSTVEFGRTIDVPVNDLSDDDDTNIRISRASKRSPVKRSRAAPPPTTISDDSDDDFQNRSSNGLRRYSQLSTTFKQASKQLNGGRSNSKPSLIQTRLLPVKIIPRNGRDPSSDSMDDDGAVAHHRRRTSSTSGAPQNNSRVEERPKNLEVLRLKVQIRGTVLLVPVDEKNRNASIEWLAKECAERYFKTHGLKPILTLQTKDGAILTGTDPISFVLEANERELVGNVIDFDLQPLVDRYSAACTDKLLPVNSEIKSALNVCQSSNILNLTDVCIRGTSSIVVMHALQRQTALRVLNLSGCSLFDAGVSELCKALPTLSSLSELDISSNGITKSGFTVFANVFLQENQQPDPLSACCNVPVGLTSLVLSHNPLGNHIGSTLSSLLNKLVSLKMLEIADCDLSDKLFSLSKNELTKAFNNSRLEELDISFNNFKDIGLEKLLQSLPARKMRALNCSSTVNSATNTDAVAKAVCTLLSGNEDCCNLKTLQLNDCGLTDKSMELITEHFDRLVRLENLELACNESLTSSSLVTILNRTVDHEIPLLKLDLGSIPKLWDTPRITDEIVLQAMDRKQSSEKKLAFLRVNTNEIDIENNLSLSQRRFSTLEQRLMRLMEDWAGNLQFRHVKQGACITYQLDD